MKLYNVATFYLLSLDHALIYTLSLHDALPICSCQECHGPDLKGDRGPEIDDAVKRLGDDAVRNIVKNGRDRKSTRLNSSHPSISYAVFCLKKKKIMSAS